MRVVVLGAGVIGVATAYWLLRDGHEVEVIERRDAAGMETSWGNGAVIHVSSVQPWSAPGVPREVLGWLGREDAPMLLRPSAIPRMWRWGASFLRETRPARHRANALHNLELALLSARCMAAIRDVTAVRYDHAARCVLKTYPDEASLRAAADAHLSLAPHGLLTEVLSRRACLDREPALAETDAAGGLAGGLFFPQDEIGDCNAFAQGLAAWCAGRGVRFRFGTTVGSLEVRAGRVSGVLTSTDWIAADAVVVALGSFSPALLRPHGIHVPIHPVKGVSVTLPRSFWPDGPRTAILDDARHLAFTPVGERYRMVGSAEVAGHDATPAPARIRALAGRVAEIFPRMRGCADDPRAVHWAGLRPMVPDGRPRIGPTAVAGLFLNTGHGHAGWTMAAGSGRRLADAVAGRREEQPSLTRAG